MNPSIFLLCFFLSAQLFSSQLAGIPFEDREKIKMLFETLFKQEPFAYTLYFDKSVSFSESILNDVSIESILDSARIDEYAQFTIAVSQPSQVFINGWNLWEKFQYLIKTKKFFFKKEVTRNRYYFPHQQGCLQRDI